MMSMHIKEVIDRVKKPLHTQHMYLNICGRRWQQSNGIWKTTPYLDMVSMLARKSTRAIFVFFTFITLFLLQSMMNACM